MFHICAAEIGKPSRHFLPTTKTFPQATEICIRF